MGKEDIRAYANSQGPDLPARTCNLIRVFAIFLIRLYNLLIWIFIVRICLEEDPFSQGSAHIYIYIYIYISVELRWLEHLGTIENCLRHGWFEPLRVNYGAKSGSKW